MDRERLAGHQTGIFGDPLTRQAGWNLKKAEHGLGYFVFNGTLRPSDLYLSNKAFKR